MGRLLAGAYLRMISGGGGFPFHSIGVLSSWCGSGVVGGVSVPSGKGEGEMIVMNNNFKKLGLTHGLGGSGFRVILLSGGGCRLFRPLLCRMTATNVRPDTVSFPFHGVFGGHGCFRVHVYRTRQIVPRQGVLRASVKIVRCSCLMVTAKYCAGCFNGSGVTLRAVSLGAATRTLCGHGRMLRDFRGTRGADGLGRQRGLVAFVVMNNKTAKVRLSNTLTRVHGFVLPRSCPSLSVRRVHVILVSTNPHLLSTFSRGSSARMRSCLTGGKIRVGISSGIMSCRGSLLALKSNATVPSAGVC